MEPSSPRSVGAFLRLGIEPASLRAVPVAAFQAAGEAPDLAQLVFDHLEGIRQVQHLAQPIAAAYMHADCASV